MHLFQKIRKNSRQIIQNRLLMDEIRKTKSQMDCAFVNFQYALEPDLIDYYIYEGNAAWKRYCFLLHLLRENDPDFVSEPGFSSGL